MYNNYGLLGVYYDIVCHYTLHDTYVSYACKCKSHDYKAYNISER